MHGIKRILDAECTTEGRVDGLLVSSKKDRWSRPAHVDTRMDCGEEK